jgi:aspartate/methionine/tyrosine aminotransferase
VTVEKSKREARQARLTDSATSAWLSPSMKASLMLDDYADRNLPSPVTAARYLSDLSEELGDVVSLSGGTIGDRLPPDFVRDAAREAVDKYPHYPGVKGHRDLRQAISRKLERENGMAADADDEIIVTIGAQQVIDSAFRVLVGAGDEVLLFDPEYASTEPAIRMAGGRVVPVPLTLEKGEWRFDFEALARRATRKTKLLVMSNGGNPSGIVYSREELDRIADLARRLDFWVFSDEEYEKTTLDGTTHCSIASFPGMKDRTITAFSFSKAYAMTAYRIGYAVGPAKVIDHVHSILRFSLQACSAVGQRAAHAVLTGDMGPWLRDNLANLERKRDYLVDRLNRIPGVRCNTPKGCYFTFPDVRGLGMPTFQLAEHLLRRGRVAVAPGFEFGRLGEGHIRLSFCFSIEQITEGMNRLERALGELPAPRTA